MFSLLVILWPLVSVVVVVFFFDIAFCFPSTVASSVHAPSHIRVCMYVRIGA